MTSNESDATDYDRRFEIGSVSRATTELPREELPKSKFEVQQTVFARDKDGVVYEAIVRRKLYGANNLKAFKASSRTGSDKSHVREKGWFYFIHFKSWKSHWDIWASEEEMFTDTEGIRQYASRLLKEYRRLKNELSKSKTNFTSADFWKTWPQRRAKVDEEVLTPLLNESTTETDSKNEASLRDGKRTSINSTRREASDDKQPSNDNEWTKFALEVEQRRRQIGLTAEAQNSKYVTLPFSLKRNLVEQWEILSNCNRVLDLPAAVTVRQALDRYIETKDRRKESAARDLVVAADGIAQNHWTAMADGMAMIFDEALPLRLLYRNEFCQLLVKESVPEIAVVRPSEYYGCEHLLRLLTRLPELLSDKLKDAESLPIFAQLNDFVRFLDKNRDELFVGRYRKLNNKEKQQKRLYYP